MNRENLKKLADGLRGPLRAEFSMEVFVDGVEEQHEVTQVGNGCGTAACACGHGTYLVEPKHEDEDFFEYAKRVFGLSLHDRVGGGFDWCFHGDWEAVDNTAVGAADRIDWMLNHGVPSDCMDQICGYAPLCYRSAA